ncbi:MAG: S9 family peptidase [Phycisphaerales bacterium]|nr:S9 family peptidase [Phycisphaerales bacterium]
MAASRAKRNGKVRGKRRTTSRRASSRRRLITAEDLLQFRWLSDPQISPDGRSIVFVNKTVGEKNEYALNLWIVSADSKGNWTEPRPFTSGNKDRHPRWSPDGSTIAFISGRTKDRPQIALISAAGGEARDLTAFSEGSLRDFKWSPDGNCIVASFRPQDPDWTSDAKKQREQGGNCDPPRVLDDWFCRYDGDGYFNAQRYALHLIDASTGKSRTLATRDTTGYFSYDFSPDGRQLAVTRNRDRMAYARPWKDEIIRINLATRRATPIRNLPEGPKSSVAWSPDGKTIAYAGRVGMDDSYSTENLELFICDPVKGEAQSLTGGEDYCLLAVSISDTSEAEFAPKLRWAPDNRRIYMQIGWHGQTHIASVARSGGAIAFHTSGAAAHQLSNLSRDGRRMAIVRGTATTLDEIGVAETGTAQFKIAPLTNLNGPLLDQLKLADIKEHWIKTADGTQVQAWVLMPPDAKSGRKYPGILEVHGGPHGQYGIGFFHEFQMLAAQGYVVVFSNPRGSKGYGREHTAAIRGSWGVADWVDIQAVHAFMKNHRGIDRSRIGIMGGSYGGYMTNWAVSHTDEFRAAITDRCVSNLVSKFGNSDYMSLPDHYWEGNAWDRPEARWNASPIKYFKGVKTPMLIIHSEGDLRCNIEQAEQVFTALKLQNVPARMVRYPRSTSHGMSRGGPPDMRLHRLHQITDWWKRWMKK